MGSDNGHSSGDAEKGSEGLMGCPLWRKHVLSGGIESGILSGADTRLHQRAGRVGQGRPEAAAKRLP